MKSPDFEPYIILERPSIFSIGSGSKVDKYKAVIKNIVEGDAWQNLVEMELKFSKGYAQGLAMMISDTIRNNPNIGISKHLHIGIVGRNIYSIVPNNSAKYILHPKVTKHKGFIHMDFKETLQHAEQGHIGYGEKIEFKMPKVANNYQEYIDMFSKRNRNIIAAVC